MSDKFTEREKGFEKKFAKDSELQFKIQARSNKYLAEFVSSILNKSEQEKKKICSRSHKSRYGRSGQRGCFQKNKKRF